MVEQATERMSIDAPPERCYEVALDFDRYADWAADIKEVQVLERDDAGRGLRVRYRAAAMGQSTSYVLRYDHSRAPEEISWVLEQGDLTRRLDGTYRFDADGRGGTEVTYNLVVELKVPLVGFIKRRAENRILHTALRDLKARVESGALA